MRRLKVSVLGCAFFSMCALVSAEDLQIVGIMQGAHPTAIINDRVVAVGDWIEGYRVVEIGGDYVAFQNPQRKFIAHLKTEQSSGGSAPSKPMNTVLIPSASKTSDRPGASANAPQPKVRVSEKAGKKLDKSLDYLRQADELLKTPLKYDGLYARAVNMCADAVREAQAALTAVTDEPGRKVVKDHLSRIQKVQTALQKERAELNTRVRTAIVGQKIFVGMSSQDVVSSWGQPLSKTNVGAQERWAYKDPNGYQKNLNFQNGVLVSF